MTIREEYWKLADYEKHFNGMQDKIRTIASGWLLAAFGAVAALIKVEHNVVWSFSPLFLLVLICTMASIGLLLLWIMDQLVYHKLLNSVFLVGLRMEHADDTLPPVRAMMMSSTGEKTGMSEWLKYYYVIPIFTFLFISEWAMLYRLYQFKAGAIDSILPALLCAVQLSFILWILEQGRTITIESRAKLFGNDDFTSICTAKVHNQLLTLKWLNSILYPLHSTLNMLNSFFFKIKEEKHHNNGDGFAEIVKKYRPERESP